jgi:hypothetical protein
MRAAIIRYFSTQKKFAEAAGTTSYRVSSAITGLMPLSLEEATLWADLLNLGGPGDLYSTGTFPVVTPRKRKSTAGHTKRRLGYAMPWLYEIIHKQFGTMEAFAPNLGISHGTVSDVLRGLTGLTPTERFFWAKLLNVDIHVLDKDWEPAPPAAPEPVLVAPVVEPAVVAPAQYDYFAIIKAIDVNSNKIHVLTEMFSEIDTEAQERTLALEDAVKSLAQKVDIFRKTLSDLMLTLSVGPDTKITVDEGRRWFKDQVTPMDNSSTLAGA